VSDSIADGSSSRLVSEEESGPLATLHLLVPPFWFPLMSGSVPHDPIGLSKDRFSVAHAPSVPGN